MSHCALQCATWGDDEELHEEISSLAKIRKDARRKTRVNFDMAFYHWRQLLLSKMIVLS